MKCDFEGYVTKNDVLCLDGRTIRKDAFVNQHNTTVPLVWQHRHDSPENVLGHMYLENREDGVYGYGVFNKTESAKNAKELIKNKDIKNMSIYANQLVEKGKNVLHGSIKEVSLVLAGANPGAVINKVSIVHADGGYTEVVDEADIYTDEEFICHDDEEYMEEEDGDDGNMLDGFEYFEHSDEEENQNGGDFGVAFSEMTLEDFESLLANLDEIEVMANDLVSIGEGKRMKQDAFEEDETLALVHYASPYYDPEYAHEYYMAHRKLKGRKKAAYENLTDAGKKEARLYKKDRFKQRDDMINTSKKATQKNIEKTKEQTKKKRAEAKKKTAEQIKKTNEFARKNASRLLDSFSKKLENASNDRERERISNEARETGNKLKYESAELKAQLEQSYKIVSKNLTENRKSKIKEARNAFDESKLYEMKKADDDYIKYVERLQDFAAFTKNALVSTGADDDITGYSKDSDESINYTKAKNRKLDEAGQTDYNMRRDTNSARTDEELDADIMRRARQNDETGRNKKSRKFSGNKSVWWSDDDLFDNELIHSDDSTIADILDTLDDAQRNVVGYILAAASQGIEDLEHSDESEELYLMHEDDSEETIGDVLNTFNEEQMTVLEYLVAKVLENNNKNINHSDEGGTNFMKMNIFENDETREDTLTHSDFVEIVNDAKKGSGTSLKETFLAHAGEDYGFGSYTNDREDGFDGVDVLFPDARLVDKKIELLRNNPTDWVAKVMSGVHKSPFSRIKMIYADITADEARAKGYVTGAKKVSEVISLLHRTTAPTTIYKLQKLDRDDIIDITDWDIVAWIKAEMRIMLEEEIARQIIVGDFRAAGDRDKIDPNCVRPILNDTDSDLYAMRHSYTVSQTENEHEKFIDECCLAQIDYEGTGSPALITSPEYVMHMLLVKDTLGNRIYKTRNELASACGVKEIIECPFFKNRTRTEDGETVNSMGFKDADGNACLCKGIIVNLSDYTVGADKGGAVNMFDDFDIDFNQLKYLIETRISGSLTKPKSAVVIGVQQ